MEVLLPVLVFVGAIWFIVGITGWFKQRWLETLNHMVHTFGLTIEPGGFWRTDKALGEVEGVPVVFDTYTVSTGKSSTTYTRITARPTWLANDITLKREGLGASLGKLFMGADVDMGDDRFDGRVVARGDETTLRAVLDATTRRLVEAALDNGIVVEDGQVRWVQSGLVRDTQRLEHATRQVVELAQALDPGNLRARLFQVVVSDPNFEVMEGALNTFLARWRLSPQEETTLLGDRRASVRLVAAAHVGERAWDVVVALLDDVRESVSIRVQALTTLQRIDHPRTVQLAQERIGRTQPTEVAVALLEVLADAEICPPLAELASVLDIRSDALRLALARCLAHSTEPVEAHLLDLLAESSEDVAGAAARSLARQGTAHAVGPLRERIKGFLVGGELKRAGEAAIAAIQSQVGALGGSLSLLREQRAEGGLSVPEREAE